LVDSDDLQFPVDDVRSWKAKAEATATKMIGVTAPPMGAPLVAPLSAKLVAPRPPRRPELKALELLRAHHGFYMRVVRLIQDIGGLEYNGITNIARPSSYDDAKRALFQRFGEDYNAYQNEMGTAVDLLEAIAEVEDGETNETITAIVAAARESATAVAGLIAWVGDRRNEPVNLATLHERPFAVDEAREAGRRLGKLAARREIHLST
jgi:hypothetical protein